MSVKLDSIVADYYVVLFQTLDFPAKLQTKTLPVFSSCPFCLLYRTALPSFHPTSLLLSLSPRALVHCPPIACSVSLNYFTKVS